MHRIVAYCLLAWAVACAVPTGLAAEPVVAFAPGQMWTIKNSPAKIIIGRVEPWRGRTAVHVSVVDIPTPDDLKLFDHIDHMPFDSEALAASADKLIAVDARPASGFQPGYDDWQARHRGLFTISVAAVVETLSAKAARGSAH